MSSVTLAAEDGSSPERTPEDRKSNDLLKIKKKPHCQSHSASSILQQWCSNTFKQCADEVIVRIHHWCKHHVKVKARAAALTIQCSTGTGFHVMWLAWWGAPLVLAHPASRHARSLDLQGTNSHQNTGASPDVSVWGGLNSFWFQGLGCDGGLAYSIIMWLKTVKYTNTRQTSDHLTFFCTAFLH